MVVIDDNYSNFARILKESRFLLFRFLKKQVFFRLNLENDFAKKKKQKKTEHRRLSTE
jgi:hypothetical protein